MTLRAHLWWLQVLHDLNAQELDVFDGAATPSSGWTALPASAHLPHCRVSHSVTAAAFEGDEYYKVDVQARLENETSVPATMYVWHDRCVTCALRQPAWHSLLVATLCAYTAGCGHVNTAQQLHSKPRDGKLTLAQLSSVQAPAVW